MKPVLQDPLLPQSAWSKDQDLLNIAVDLVELALGQVKVGIGTGGVDPLWLVYTTPLCMVMLILEVM